MCKQGTRLYLQAVAAQIIQAYEVEDDDHVTFAGEVDWVCERAPVDEADEVIRRYLAGPCVRASSGVRPATTLGVTGRTAAVADRAAAAGSGRRRRLPGRLGSGHVTAWTCPEPPGDPPAGSRPRTAAAR